MEIQAPPEDADDQSCDRSSADRVDRDTKPHSALTSSAAPGGRHRDGRSLRRRARLRGWKLPITDGPFAETKEM